MNTLPEPEDEVRAILERLARLFTEAAQDPDSHPQVLSLARKELAALERLQEQDPSSVPRAVIQTWLRRIAEYAAVRLILKMMRDNILDRLIRPQAAA